MASPPAPGSATCPHCNAPLPALESRFCGSCGQSITYKPGSAPIATPAVPLNVVSAVTTNQGSGAQPAPVQPAAPPPAPTSSAPKSGPPVRSQMRTMMGAFLPSAPNAAPPSVGQPVHAQPAAPPPAATEPSAAAPQASAPPSEAAAANAPTTGAPKRVANRQATMFGVAGPAALQGLAPVSQGPAMMPSASAPPSSPPPTTQGPVSNVPARVANKAATMVGVSMQSIGIAPIGAPPVAGAPSVPPPGAPAPSAPPSGYGMAAPMGPPPPLGPPPGYGAPMASPAFSPGRTSDEDIYVPGISPRRSGGSPIAVIAAVLILLAGAGTAAALFLRGRGGSAPVGPLEAQVQVDPANGAIAVVVRAPDLAAGTALRYGAQTAALDADHSARFALEGASSVGSIEVPVDVTLAGGATERRTARVVVAYRVEPDLAHLADERPAVSLNFRVAPGSHLFVDEHEVRVNPDGSAPATIPGVQPLPSDGPAALEHDYRVRVAGPDGSTAQGTYHLRVPRTPLQVQRPAVATWRTLADRVIVRGRAPGASRLTVDGVVTAVAASDGEFSSVVALPAPGPKAVDVIAYAPNGAPALARISVERLGGSEAAVTLRAGAASSTAALAGEGPGVGSWVAYRGRALGDPREHDGGQTFQLVIPDGPCPGGRCLLWVDAEPGAAARVRDGQNVEVIGVVSGRRASVTTGGERRSDPIVLAAVLQ